MFFLAFLYTSILKETGRKPNSQTGQVVTIGLLEDLDPKTPVGDLFAGGLIEVVVTSVNGVQVKLGLNADPRFLDRWFRTRATSSIPGVVARRIRILRQLLPALRYLPTSMWVAGNPRRTRRPPPQLHQRHRTRQAKRQPGQHRKNRPRLSNPYWRIAGCGSRHATVTFLVLNTRRPDEA